MTQTERAAPRPEGWHQQDILAEIRKRGVTIASLNRDNGFKKGVLGTAFYRRWPGGQKIIADFLGVPIEELWPHWYGPGGKPHRLQGAVSAPRAAKTA